jgi:hypothetical protein
MLRLTPMVMALFVVVMRSVAVDAQGSAEGNLRGAGAPLKDDPKYAYLRDEIERLSRSTKFECRNISIAARFWWDKNRVFGFSQRVVVTDPATGLAGFLGGEASSANDTYEMRLYLPNRTKNEILKTFRHESAHAAGIADERAARSLAEKCH